MKKFMLLYMSPMSADQKMANMTDEDKKKMMEPWMAWKEKVGSAMVDFGLPLVNGMHAAQSGNTKSDAHATGYSIVQAEDMDGALALLSGHPYMSMPDGSIEVFEMMPMEM